MSKYLILTTLMLLCPLAQANLQSPVISPTHSQLILPTPDGVGRPISSLGNSLSRSAQHTFVGVHKARLHGVVLVYNNSLTDPQLLQTIDSRNQVYDDNFGLNVVVEGSLALISSKNHVYLYLLVNQEWQYHSELIGDHFSLYEGTRDMRFSFDIKGNEFVVSRVVFEPNTTNIIESRVFKWQNNQVVHQQLLEHPSPVRDNYGFYTAGYETQINDNQMMIGVSLFVRENNQWVHDTSFHNYDPGFNININNMAGEFELVDDLLVFTDSNGFISSYTDRGLLIVFEKINGQWLESQVIENPGDSTGFGRGLVIMGESILVGDSVLKKIYEYRMINQQWQQVAAFDVDNVANHFLYEFAFETDQSQLIVTTGQDLRFFKKDNNGWELFNQIDRDDSSEYRYFGSFLTQSNQWLAVSAPGSMNSIQGSVEIFQLVEEQWQLFQTIYSIDIEEVAKKFGHAMAIDDNTLLIGTGNAEAHQFHFDGVQWVYFSTISLNSDPIFNASTMGIKMFGDKLILGSNQSGFKLYRKEQDQYWSHIQSFNPCANLYCYEAQLTSDEIFIQEPYNSELDYNNGAVHLYRFNAANGLFEFNTTLYPDPMDLFLNNQEFGTRVRVNLAEDFMIITPKLYYKDVKTYKKIYGQWQPWEYRKFPSNWYFDEVSLGSDFMVVSHLSNYLGVVKVVNFDENDKFSDQYLSSDFKAGLFESIGIHHTMIGDNKILLGVPGISRNGLRSGGIVEFDLKQHFHIRGQVTGELESDLLLSLNDETLLISPFRQGEQFHFSKPVAVGDTYSVSVSQQPHPLNRCTVQNFNGVIMDFSPFILVECKTLSDLIFKNSFDILSSSL